MRCARGAVARRADTITVTTSLDTSVSQCTLRDAIDAANTAATSGACVYGTGGTPADPDTINFNLPTLPATINLATALPEVLYPLTIAGPGASQLDVHRSSGSNFRILLINPNGLNDTDVISGLTLSNGNLVDSVGAGIDTRDADLTLDHVVVTGNHAGANFTGGGNGQGGGIFNNNDGTLHLIGSTVSDNHLAVVAPSGIGGAAFGGGIDNEGTMTVIDSTISGNDATETASGSNLAIAYGGGIVSNPQRSSAAPSPATASARPPSPAPRPQAAPACSRRVVPRIELAPSRPIRRRPQRPRNHRRRGGGIYVNTPEQSLPATRSRSTPAGLGELRFATPPPPRRAFATPSSRTRPAAPTVRCLRPAPSALSATTWRTTVPARACSLRPTTWLRDQSRAQPGTRSERWLNGELRAPDRSPRSRPGVPSRDHHQRACCAQHTSRCRRARQRRSDIGVRGAGPAVPTAAGGTNTDANRSAHKKCKRRSAPQGQRGQGARQQ